ncbi:MAG: YfhO family protein [Acidobacteriota bacterium]
MRRYAPFAVLLAEVLLFYRRVLFSSAYGIPWDLREYHRPLAEFMARCLRNGELPLWDPYTYCGFPFYANVQAQVFYPPAWITLALSNLAGGHRLLGFLEWQVALHVFLGGVFTYWLLRRLDLSRGAATFGATIFQLGGYFASQSQHLGAISGGAWLPLAWLSLLALGERFAWRWLVALALALAMAVLAGFPAVTVVVFASCALLAGALVALRRASPRLLGFATLGCVWAGLLSAAQLLPIMELSALSMAPRRGEWFGTGGGLPLAALGSLLIPNYGGIFDRAHLPPNTTFLYLYCGWAGLVLSLAGLIWSRDRRRAVFAVATLLSGLWMLGASTPVGAALFAALPTAAKSVVYPEFAMLSFQLGVAALAALGAERLLAGRHAVLAAALVAVAVIELILAGSGRPMNTMVVRDDPGVTLREFEGSRETLERMRSLVNQTVPPARVEGYRDSWRWANFGLMTGIPTASGNDPLALERILAVRRIFGKGEYWLRYWELFALDSPVPDLLNVRYLISYAPSAEPAVRHPKWARVADLPGHQVYENRDVLPRFFLVSEVRAVPPGSPGFDPRRAASVEGLPAFTGAPGEVKVLKYTLREVALEVNAAGPSFLVTSEAHYPGWRAFVDGRPARLFLTNVAFRGLPVPAGRHRVEMRFEPHILWYGLALSALAWALLAWALVTGRARR